LSRRKMSAPDRSYGWYKAHCFNDYMERVIGEYGAELEQMVFNDESTNTDYLDCVKFCADLVWHEYQVKQEEAHPRPDTALVNTDVLDTVLLSLHPAEVVAASEEVSQRSKEGLAQLHRFYALIKLEKVEEEEMKALLENLPDEYAAMLSLMCWFVTLASKMTGREIPGVGMAPGGKIVKPEEEVKEHLCNMLAVAEAMSASYHWNYLAQYSILKEMLADLRIIARGENLEGAGSTSIIVEQFEKQFDQLEEQLEEHVDDASAQEEETGKLALAPTVSELPGVGQHGVGQDGQEEQVGADQVDTQLVEQLHFAYRLGGHGAAAFALWWLEEGPNSGFHFDQAGVTFQGLPTEVKEGFLWRAIVTMANNPLEERREKKEEGVDQ